jgi:hypothetical protein
MSKDVPHAIPEPAAEFLNHLVNGMTAAAGVAPVLDKRHFPIGIPEDVVAAEVNWRCQTHSGSDPPGLNMSAAGCNGVTG